ncbi:hypothetical protein PRZ48_000218 [Zasmidium cellare]|uniref:Uncharacterized protein n=1 Tax=Zasmidium cellare TaxID=395010 RepID=A0ABR0EZB8_ZASCE|nr:hypothetical protein PRZ48_000218 [Zasmidium cellare]
MSSTTPLPLQPYNYSYPSIPLAFGLAIAPHAYGLIRLMLATRGQLSNSMPRTNLEAQKTKLPAALYNQLIRARGAHLNSLEVFPLFAAAMVAGNVAGLEVGEMNRAAWTFLGARSGLWAWSISIPIMALVKAGRKASEGAQ